MKHYYKRILLSFIILAGMLFHQKAYAQYAIGGTAGNMVKSVYWLRWDPSTMTTKPGTFTGTGSDIVAGTYVWQYSPTARITAILSTFSGVAIKPYTPGNYSGDGLDLIYSGNNLTKPNSRSVSFSGISASGGTGKFDIEIKIEMLINNVWTLINFPGMIIGDAESVDGSGEFFSAKTTATAWQLLNKHTNAPTTDPTYALTLTNAGKDFNVHVTSGSGNLGIQAVMYAHGVNKLTDVQLRGSGTTAIALGFVFPFDLGDAPASYGANVAHYIDNFDFVPFTQPGIDGTFPIVTYTEATLTPKANVYIGTNNVDADGTAVHGALANDDNTIQNNDEATLTPAGYVDIKVNQAGDYVIPTFNVTNGNASPATVYMWLDFNGDGVFSADEIQTATVPANTTNSPISFTFPNAQFAAKIKAGPLYGRIRITTSAISDDAATTNLDERSTAFAADGETEDYKFKDILGLTISGTVVNDGNGKTDNVLSGTGLNTLGASTITAYLVDNATSLIVAKTTIAADGTYSFANIANNGTYIVAISTNGAAAVGANISTIPPALPAGWTAVGESFGVNNNVTGIESGTPNLQIQVVTPGTSLDVTGVNFAVDQNPVAVNDNSASTPIDVNITVDVLANDTDANGVGTIDKTSVKLIDPADGFEKVSVTTAQGVYTVNATTGEVTFDPVATFTGITGGTAATTIKYIVLDNAGAKSNQGTLNIKVKPVGVNDTGTTPKNVAITTTVKGNDGVSGSNVGTTVSSVTGPTNGAIVVNADGTIKYTPNNNYVGTDTYTYRLTTADGVQSDPITVTITISSPPVAVANASSTNEDVTLTVADGATGVGGDILVNDTDADGDVLTVVDYTIFGVAGTQAVGAPVVITGIGTITINADGSYTFVPVANYFGAVPQITYKVTDGFTPVTSTLDITVNPVNDVPSFTKGADQSQTINTAAVIRTVTGWATALSKGPANESGQVFDFIVSNNNNALFATQPAIDANGNLTYTPGINKYGKATATVQIHDDGGTTNGGVNTSASQTFVIEIKPVGVTDTYSTPKNVAITSTVTSNDGASGVGTTVVTGGTAPAHGAIVINPDGTIKYTPTAGYIGTDSYTYILSTPDGVNSDPITVNITITNTPPVVSTITKSGNEDVTIPFTAADFTTKYTDADSDPLTKIKVIDLPANGKLKLNGVDILAGAEIAAVDLANITFVPDANWNGNTSFHWNGFDGTTYAVANGLVNITITPVNDAPTPAPDVKTTLEDTPVTVLAAAGLLSNDTDVDGDSPLGVTKYTIAGIIGDQAVGDDVLIPGVGTINIGFGGGYKFTPVLNFNGPVPVITYTVNDLQGPSGSATSTLTINVTPVNDIPSFTKGADQTTTIGAATQTVTPWATAISKGPANESAQNVNFVVTNDKNTLFTTQPAISSTGVLTYTPAPGQYGKATVTVYIHDDGGTTNGGVDQSATQTFVINVKPVGVTDTDITPINTATTTVVTGNDGPSGIGTSVVPGGTNPAHGTITINPDRSITYTPDNNYVGTDSYTYILRTPDGVDSDPITVNITVYNPKISLAKEGTYNDFNANGKVDVGDRINYTFVVTNTGTVAVTNITITDPSATITGGPIASLAVAGVDNSTFTGFHTLTQAEIDNGGVFNLATASGKDPKNNTITTTSNDPTPLVPGDAGYPVTPPTPACPTCTVTPVVQTGSLSLTKDGTYNDFNADGKVNVGDRINYVFVVTNTGNVTLTNVTITDPDAIISGGPIASFAPGAVNNSTFTGYHVITQADLDNSGVYNIATATGKDPRNTTITTKSNDPTPLAPGDPNYPVTPPTPACPTCTITPIVQTGALSLLKDGSYNDFNADGKVNVGDRINYTFKVTNTGNVTLHNVTVTDPSATITGGPIATLAVGAQDNSTFTGFHILTQADLDNSGVYNLATANGLDPKNKPVTTTSNDPTPLAPGDPNYPVTPPTPACPTCTITPVAQAPSLSLTKDGSYNDFNADGKVNVGDRIKYVFVVTNTGNVTLTNVTITDPDAVITGGPIASFAPGAVNNSTFTGYHILTQADLDNSGVYNIATANGKDPKNNTITTKSNDPTPLAPGDPNYPVTPPTPACPTCTITPIVQAPSMTLKKDGTYNDFNADGKVNIGDRINYAFTLTNTGNVTITNVMITDANAVITGGPIASFAPGAINTSTFTGYHILTAADLDNGGVFNVATATGKDPKGNDVPPVKSDDPTPLLPTDPSYPITPPVTPCPTCTVTPLPQSGSLALLKEGVYFDQNADGKVNAGDRINYTFKVTNTGNVTLTNVTVTDPNAIITGGPLASLAAGAIDATTFTGYHVLTAADLDNGGVFNVATVKGTDPRGNDVTKPSDDPTPLLPTDPSYPITPPVTPCPTCTVTPLPQNPSMRIVKDGTYVDSNGDGRANPGDRINYTFTVINTGNVTITNIMITDNNATVVGGPIPSLAAGASNSTTFTAFHILTQAELDNGGVFNVATATGKDPRGNDVPPTKSDDPTPIPPGDPSYPVTPPVTPCPTCTITPIVQAPSMRLVKDGTYNDTNGDGKVNPGDRINYTFTVINTGNVTLTNITVTDNNAVVSGGPIASLAPGASNNNTFTAYHILTQAELDNGGVFNVAVATGKDPKGGTVTTPSDDPTPIPPGDPSYPVTPPVTPCPTCTITPIVQTPSMRLVKDGTYNDTNGDGKVNPGDRINYTFTVINTGNVTLTNITVTDTNAVMSGGPLATLAPGASNSTMFTAYHILTQTEIDNGGVFNVATATGKDPKGGTVTTPSNDPTPILPTDPSYPVTPPVTPCPTCTITPVVMTPSLSLLKDGAYNDTNGDGKVNIGDRINYTFTVTNTGNVTITNVTVTDPNAVITGGPIASMAPGASNSTTFTGYHVLTQADIDNRGVFNSATASGKDPKGGTITTPSTDPTPLLPSNPLYPINPPVPACPTCTVTPITQSGSIALVKAVTNTGTGVAGAFVLGNPIQYTFTITNTGNVTLSNIVLTDVKLGIGTVNVSGTLAPGASTTLIRTYTITAADIAAGNVTNTATINATTPAGTPVTDVSGSTTTNNTPTVTGLGKPPVANNDVATTRQNDPVKISIETNDVAGSTPIVPNSIVITVAPLHGTVLVNADGTVTYTPNAGYVGTDVFTYTVKDTNGQTSNPAVVNITVVQSAPKAIDDIAKTSINKQLIIPVLDNDVKDGANFNLTSVEIMTQPVHGRVVTNSDGTITYIPNTDYAGPDSFTYRVKDAYGNYTNIATVNITVEGFFAGNVITPDGDGKNDFWVIVGSINYDRIEVEFYNRWGNQVYVNTNYKNDWNGEGLNEGTYYYTVRLMKGGVTTTAKGWVLVKR